MYVARMPDELIPKQLLFSELADSKRSVGGQKKCFKDTLKAFLKSFDFDIDTWNKVAVDRPTSRSLTRRAVRDMRRGELREPKRSECISASWIRRHAEGTG